MLQQILWRMPMMLLGFSTQTVLSNNLNVGKALVESIHAVLAKPLHHFSWIIVTVLLADVLKKKGR